MYSNWYKSEIIWPGTLRSMIILSVRLSTTTTQSGTKIPLSLRDNPHLHKAHKFIGAAVTATPLNPMFANVLVFC
jgi:hypothetical protein